MGGPQRMQLQRQVQEERQIEQQQVKQAENIQLGPQVKQGQMATGEQEQLVQSEVTQNQELVAQATRQMEPIQAQTTAQGSPAQQQQKPARMSRKQKKAAEKKAKQDRINHAKERIGEGAAFMPVDEYTAVIADKLAMRKRSIRETGDAEEYGETFQKADSRLKSTMLQGHIMNAQEEPINAEEAQKKAEDIQLMDDYKSENIHRRRPIIMKYFKRIMDIKLDKALADGVENSAFLAENIIQLDQMSQDLIMLENVLRDPLNQAIFEELPVEMRNYLDTKCRTGNILSNQLISNLGRRGLSYNAMPTSTNHTIDSDFMYQKVEMEDALVRDEMFRDTDQKPLLLEEIETLNRLEEEARTTYQTQRQAQQIVDTERIKALAQAKRGGADNVTMDHISAQIYDNLQQLDAERSSILADEEVSQLVRTSGVDDRVLKIMFHQRFNMADLEKTDKMGDYARSVRQASIQRVKDYASKDLEKRRPILDMVVDEFLNFRFTEEMFTQGRMGHNAAIYAEISDKMTYFENVRDDVINKPYFDALPQATKGFLNQKHKIMTSAFSTRFMAAARTKGIETNTRKFTHRSMDKESVDNMNVTGRTVFTQAIKDLKEAERTFKGGNPS